MLIAMGASTGFRKAEMVLGTDDTWDSDHLSRASVSWVVQGVHRTHLSRAQLLALREGDYVQIKPPPSKADPYALVWGTRPIYGAFKEHDKVNMARELRDLFLAYPVSAGDASDTPLLVFNDAKPMTGPFVDRILRDLLRQFMGLEEAKKYSPHSFRVYLACALRASGATDSEVQALCRWQSLASLRIYALLDAPAYARLQDKALRADAAPVRFRGGRRQVDGEDMPVIDESDIRVQVDEFVDEVYVDIGPMDMSEV